MPKPTTLSIPMPLRGLNQNENPNSLKDADLILAENVWFRGDTVGTRPGLEIETSGEDYDAQLSDGAVAIQSGVEFRATTDTVRKHVVVANGKVWSDDSTNVNIGAASITITAGANNLWTFCEHKDQLYAAGGANGDSIWAWDGSSNATKITFQSDTNADGSADSNIDAKYIFQKWGYGWLGGLNGTVPDDNPMVVRYSALNNMTSWPIGNTIGGSSAVGGFDSYGDNYVTGFASYTDNKGDWLIVGTRKCLYSILQTSDYLQPFIIDSVIQNGLVHHNAYVSLGTDSGEAVYMSERGIHSMRQSQAFGDREDRYLSWPIRKTFAEIRRNRLKHTCGTYWAEEGLVVFLVTLGHANTTHNALLCLDVRGADGITADTSRWTIWRINGDIVLNRIWTARCGTGYAAAPNREFLYGGTTAGKVVRFNPDSGSFSDLGGAYTTTIQTAHRSFDAPGVTKGLGDVWIHLQRSTGANFNLGLNPVFDYGARTGTALPIYMELAGSKLGTGKLGSFVLGGGDAVQVKHLYGIGSGDSIGWKLQTSGVNEAFFLTSLAYQVSGLGEDLGQ